MMKYWFILLATLSMYCTCIAQEIGGIWQSNTDSPIIYMDLYIDNDRCEYARLNVPIQGVKDFEAQVCKIENDSLLVQYSFMNIVAKVKLSLTDKDTLRGTWQQGKITRDITFRQVDEIEKILRPQTPEPPFNYINDTLFFSNPEDSVQLHAILSMPISPQKQYPAVVLVSGSGPSDWDQTILDHKSFWVIADYLSSRGVAVLRYHDRGVSTSGGNHTAATSLDLALDAVYAVEYLRSRPEIHPDKVGIVGHSEGGMIAPISYSMNQKIGFIVSLAGPGEDITRLMIKQNMLAYDSTAMPTQQYHKINRFYNDAISLIAQDVPTESLYQPLQGLCNQLYQDVDIEYFPSTTKTKEQMYMQLIQARFIPWYNYFFRIKPREYWSQVHCPVLALNGSEDIQVTAIDNIREITNALNTAGNDQLTSHVFEGLNHLFQQCNTCEVSEYGYLTTTIETEVLEKMSNWILDINK